MLPLKKFTCLGFFIFSTLSLYGWGGCNRYGCNGFGYGYGGCGRLSRGADCCCCFEGIYFSVAGGFTSSIGEAKNQFGTGSLQNGISTHAQFLPGGHIEGKIGYDWWGPCIAFDVSYTYFSSNYNWDEIFGVNLDSGFASTNIFESHLNSHVVLFNAYLNFDKICCSPFPSPCVSPYIFGGIGAAWNHLHDIKQYISNILPLPPQLIATVDDHTHSNFAARFGLGIMSNLSDCFKFQAGIHATYIGSVRSGDFVDFGGLQIPIDPYHFKDNWLGSFFIGIQYQF